MSKPTPQQPLAAGPGADATSLDHLLLLQLPQAVLPCVWRHLSKRARANLHTTCREMRDATYALIDSASSVIPVLASAAPAAAAPRQASEHAQQLNGFDPFSTLPSLCSLLRRSPNLKRLQLSVFRPAAADDHRELSQDERHHFISHTRDLGEASDHRLHDVRICLPWDSFLHPDMLEAVCTQLAPKVESLSIRADHVAGEAAEWTQAVLALPATLHALELRFRALLVYAGVPLFEQLGQATHLAGRIHSLTLQGGGFDASSLTPAVTGAGGRPKMSALLHFDAQMPGVQGLPALLDACPNLTNICVRFPEGLTPPQMLHALPYLESMSLTMSHPPPNCLTPLLESTEGQDALNQLAHLGLHRSAAVGLLQAASSQGHRCDAAAEPLDSLQQLEVFGAQLFVEDLAFMLQATPDDCRIVMSADCELACEADASSPAAAFMIVAHHAHRVGIRLPGLKQHVHLHGMDATHHGHHAHGQQDNDPHAHEGLLPATLTIGESVMAIISRHVQHASFGPAICLLLRCLSGLALTSNLMPVLWQLLQSTWNEAADVLLPMGVEFGAQVPAQGTRAAAEATRTYASLVEAVNSKTAIVVLGSCLLQGSLTLMVLGDMLAAGMLPKLDTLWLDSRRGGTPGDALLTQGPVQALWKGRCGGRLVIKVWIAEPPSAELRGWCMRMRAALGEAAVELVY